MMRLFDNPQLIFILILASLVSACASIPGTKPGEEEGETDMFELERQADAAYQKGDMTASEKDYLVLVKRMPEEALHWFRLGNIYARTQRPDAAIVAYREAVLRKPDYSKAWYNMGIIQLKEAANTFNEMQVHTHSDDALSIEGKKLLEEILEIIKQD